MRQWFLLAAVLGTTLMCLPSVRPKIKHGYTTLIAKYHVDRGLVINDVVNKRSYVVYDETILAMFYQRPVLDFVPYRRNVVQLDRVGRHAIYTYDYNKGVYTHHDSNPNPRYC